MEKQEIIKIINNNPWFAKYYDLKELWIIWLRDNIEREEIYSKYNFNWKKVLDVWCNIWKNFIYLNNFSPKSLIWIDTKKSIEICNVLKDYYKLDKANYYELDLNLKNWFNILEQKTNIKKYDYSFYVSVYWTKELYNRDNILKDLINNTNEIIFFEWHNLNSKESYSKILLKHNVRNFECNWYLRDKTTDKSSWIRPFFTISNIDFDIKYILNKISEIKDKKWKVIVWIEWLAWSGKTSFLKEKLSILKENITKSIFIDDLKDENNNSFYPTNTLVKNIKYKLNKIIKNNKKILSIWSIINDKNYDLVVISDYKLRKYINYCDILISIETEEKSRKERLVKRSELLWKSYFF